jgi:eukaryotic-like serine/threonine-protein kinase
MTPDRQDCIEQICQAALDVDEASRAAFLAERCADDEGLRREVESLLAYARAAESFIERPALESEARRFASIACGPKPERIGPYEVLSLLGSGGMGDVYRARDPRLAREIALKVLPAMFASDKERLARFEREARALAALNQPNIGAIYGVAEAADAPALVLELVEGETLVEKLHEQSTRTSTGLPLAEVLGIARQIAMALEAAHAKGIIHRDLKPANIKVSAQGTVKVLDFGLAKLARPAHMEEGAPRASDPSLTTEHGGALFGTAAYMSPEQARGQSVDARTDIWAFGCVLYEMLTGHRPFAGMTVTDTLAAVIGTDPDWDRLPLGTPESIRRLVQRCLRKERELRLRDIGDARIEIEDAQSGALVHRPVPAGWSRGRKTFPWAVATLILLVAAAGLARWLAVNASPPSSSGPSPVRRLTVSLPGDSPLLVNVGDRNIALSRDGTRLAYIGGPRGSPRLFVRAMDSLQPATVHSVPNYVRGTFFSPDGQWVLTFDPGGLMKVSLNGKPAVQLAPIDGTPRGATWGADGAIIFATNNIETGLWRVSEDGGVPTQLTRPNRARGELDHTWPELLPGDRAVLFTVRSEGGPAAARVAVLDLQTGAQKVLLEHARNARYLASGHLVYTVKDGLHAVAFDADRLEKRGTPVPVLSTVVTSQSSYFDVSRDGTLVYVPGPLVAGPRSLLWVDRMGREEAITAPPRAYEHPRISPDGTRVALDVVDEERDIWIWHFARETLTRFTFGPWVDLSALWTPDGQRVLFASNRAGGLNVFSQAADGSGPIERLTSVADAAPLTISPDGKRLVVRNNPATPDMVLLTLDGTRHTEPLVQTPAVENGGQISPDGRWLAYESWETGQCEIYVRPFPDVNHGRWQVSAAGGAEPIWARNSRELFYKDPGGALMAVRVHGGRAWTPNPPMTLLSRPYFADFGQARTYDVSPDGKRFLMIKAQGDASTSPTTLIVVQNWFEELNRLVPRH